MQTAKDPLTGESFLKQRSNQVFANRENQIKYNNLKALQKRQAMAEVNTILNKNRSILKSTLNGNKEVVKSLDFLLGAGFNFGCSTHTIKHNDKKWNCIYDFAYLLMGNKQFKIIQLKQ
ncbi:MAG: hypothetical protein JKY53_13765 [Flavobacteriales bacterium]|nr:hypothetical protein [Flavobacteriales bacterium]